MDRLTLLRGKGMPALFSWSCKRYTSTLLVSACVSTQHCTLENTTSYKWLLCICVRCFRNYKNGYVWNDLSENDVIYPSDGVEYVLKGSEIFPGCSSGTYHYHHLLALHALLHHLFCLIQDT